MDIWCPEKKYLRYTNGFNVSELEDVCFKYNYQFPKVGYCRVPNYAWCRNQGRFCVTFTLYGKSKHYDNYFGIITGFTVFSNSLEEAVNKLVFLAVDFITWRSQCLNVYG
uniref:Nonstructural protein n=1 Tax=Porcine hemagglutinating encephalomyelitis virus TaxID=42005 RepID=A0A1V0IGB4_9BETC|nr:nonstructural protein [Porcine hemagglutinating encephalomyelitis virus]ARC95236.1 nonstructural protein [Porcine hemagglutinating encephalomyelitis virus]ARC95244.1 nonstructural protein [Porcine hemagglutinating encephalomyelitis virus]ARC95260.1 nonstructural protein [Porcine hemagglutinating encephalomyelitis virus]ARC95275.1 nonstructural protein [Porcine hemagglutinating encephalomyelitis virus]